MSLWTVVYKQWWIQDFPDEGGHNFQFGGTNLVFDQFFLKNCMKSKLIGPGGGMSLVPPLDPPMIYVEQESPAYDLWYNKWEICSIWEDEYPIALYRGI